MYKSICIVAQRTFGGGLVQLEELTTGVAMEVDRGLEATIISCSRHNHDYLSKVIDDRIRVKLFLSIFSWVKLIYNREQDYDVFMNFLNIPPLFACFIRAKKRYTFLHNNLLFEKLYFWPSYKLRIKRLIFKLYVLFSKNDTFIVQSYATKLALENAFPKLLNRIQVCAFSTIGPKSTNFQMQEDESSVELKFILVTSGEKHKNNDRLLRGWKRLKQRGYNSKLIIVIDQELYGTELKRLDRKFNFAHLGIEVLTGVSCRQELFSIFGKCDYLLFPSLNESLGLPLLEAENCGLKIVASNRNFVNAACRPHLTFDPLDENSIYYCLELLHTSEVKLQIKTPQRFVRDLLQN